ncbi:MAG TPA: HIT domain-containing protein [Candidatus Saccharimonadales bacterium]|nr:HIT domain-containing protein [Candidatus Saccharimonadales bacterium]
MEDCLFCQIVREEVQSEQIIETTNYVAFKDIHPKAPVHVLIVPKRHVERPEELRGDEITDMLQGAEEVAQIMGVKDTGYRLVFNVGNHPGQVIDHVHLHLLGGAPAKSMY